FAGDQFQIILDSVADISIRIPELSNIESLCARNVIQKIVDPTKPGFDFFQTALPVPLLDQRQAQIKPRDILFSIAGNGPLQALPGLGKLIGKILRAADITPNTLPRRAPGRKHEVGVTFCDALKKAKGGFIVSAKQRPPTRLKGASDLHRGSTRRKKSA